jgi:hypothetical protein
MNEIQEIVKITYRTPDGKGWPTKEAAERHWAVNKNFHLVKQVLDKTVWPYSPNKSTIASLLLSNKENLIRALMGVDPYATTEENRN